MTNKIVLITGVTKGLGRALVDKFAKNGYTIAGCGRTLDKIIELKSLYPEPHSFTEIDITNYDMVLNWYSNLKSQKKIPHLIINNAAIINKSASLWKINETEFSKVIDINIKGTVNIIRAFVPEMIKQKKGIIANISSGWGRCTSPDVAPYCASKFAIEGLTRALAQELPNGVATVSVNPGIIDTDMLRSAWGNEAGNCQKPEEWSKRALHFFNSLTTEHNGKALTI